MERQGFSLMEQTALVEYNVASSSKVEDRCISHDSFAQRDVFQILTIAFFFFVIQENINSNNS